LERRGGWKQRSWSAGLLHWKWICDLRDGCPHGVGECGHRAARFRRGRATQDGGLDVCPLEPDHGPARGSRFPAASRSERSGPITACIPPISTSKFERIFS
jgi:hypothetical protein